ncbi:PREDICTED: uncharacterized protein K02A2.6-like [Priapulus caudatus]|uniref:Uncharacterized protein K02A2.6-like n=1 Tax=Priapulus caudatus TaxID=37621 RepID=A0ABM1EM36_PRICU|nr:PREDICTED: uncharacterized protein K02A2.6-like [Priapulus caudatus]
MKNVIASIHVKSEATPVFCKARTVPYLMKPKIDQELDRLIEANIIQPVVSAEWAAPIVPILKPDNTIATHFRHLKISATLSGGVLFTKLDMAHAYQQIELDERSKQYTTINTHRGLFVYSRLAFGISSAPAIFQRVIENLLAGIPRTAVYLDDILVSGASKEKHQANLEEVLQRLAETGLRLRKNKCCFGMTSVQYLGHQISKDGLATLDNRVIAIVAAPKPKDVKQVRAFLAYGVGAVLAHVIAGDEHPVCYHSRTLQPAEKNYAQVEKEALAMMRWALILQGYDYELVYRPGPSIANADALSRLPLPQTIEIPVPPSVVNLMQHLEGCPVTCTMIQQDTKLDSVMVNRYRPAKAPLHPWEYAANPWSRIHVDFAGPFLGHMFLVIADSHTKWLEVFMMQKITSQKTVEKLRFCFATHKFISANGICHTFTAPYHPSSNGLTERAVQSFKEKMKHMQTDSLQTRLTRWLANLSHTAFNHWSLSSRAAASTSTQV